MPKSAGPDVSRERDARLLIVLRTIRGMTQMGLQKASAVSRSTLSRIETAKKDIGRQERVKLADGLGISVRTFDEMAALIRRIDREAAGGPVGLGGAESAWENSSTLQGEVSEGSGEARSALRRERHRRIAEAAGRATEQTVFEMLALGDPSTYDEY